MAATNKATSSIFCSTCQIAFASTAEIAIHEFSKKHCDNLLRVSKNKPVKKNTPKPVAPPPPPAPDVNATAVIEPSPIVNISLYGYFDPNNPIETKPKEFNTEYDPYLQKLADNPMKEALIMPTTNVTSFSKSKRKKKRTCAICRVDCMNIPEYDAHMKSARHVYMLKMSGMGVSAHFVKAGADLHTTELVPEEQHSGGEDVQDTAAEMESSKVPLAPAELYCDVCQLLLNSVGQYTAHVTGKAHNDALKKIEKKSSPATPVANQLFCYTCRLPLNNVNQYNDHKKGKKHHIKCRQLIREGYTIPPEERPEDMPWPGPRRNADLKYPELYQEMLDEQSQAEAAKLMPPPAAPVCGPSAPAVLPPVNIMTGMHHCPHCSDRFATASKLESHVRSHKTATAAANGVFAAPNKASAAFLTATPSIDAAGKEIEAKSQEKKLPEARVRGFKCSLCEISCVNQPPFEKHLNSEEHALKIMEVKKSGKSSKAILDQIMADRKVIAADCYGRFCCGICAVVSHSAAEVDQHLKCLLHKYAERDYTKKRMIEIQQSITSEEGKFSCRLCKESFEQLTLYNAHLHSTAHRNLFWKDHIKKNYIRRWLFTPARKGRAKPQIDPRCPGIRTKIAGIERDLKSGIVVPIPNLETIEPKIDLVKNVKIGVSQHEVGPSASKKKKKKKKTSKKMTLLPARRLPGMVYKGLRPLFPPRSLKRIQPAAVRPNPMHVPNLSYADRPSRPFSHGPSYCDIPLYNENFHHYEGADSPNHPQRSMYQHLETQLRPRFDAPSYRPSVRSPYLAPRPRPSQMYRPYPHRIPYFMRDNNSYAPPPPPPPPPPLARPRMPFRQQWQWSDW